MVVTTVKRILPFISAFALLGAACSGEAAAPGSIGSGVNDLAPFSMQWWSDGVADFGGDAQRSIVAPEFPVEAEATFAPGAGTVVGDVTVYYCTEGAESFYLIDEVRFEIPIEVSRGGAGSVTVSCQLPALLGV